MATGMRLLTIALLLCLPHLAAAEVLPDPTRPAIDLNSSGSGGSAEAAVPEEAATRGLQSIIISPLYRAAIINGETVRVGGKAGDAKLVEVRESSVVLQNAQGRRSVVELFPRVSIKKNESAWRGESAQRMTSGVANQPEREAGGNQ